MTPVDRRALKLGRIAVVIAALSLVLGLGSLPFDFWAYDKVSDFGFIWYFPTIALRILIHIFLFCAALYTMSKIVDHERPRLAVYFFSFIGILTTLASIAMCFFLNTKMEARHIGP
jgi:hypothetical protein